MTMKAIDISNWQGVVSESVFRKNKGSIPCVILRSSYTSTSSFSLHKDKSFDSNIKHAHSANVAVGAYHFSQAKSETEAIKEAEFVIKTLKPYKGMITLPVAFDWEFNRRLTASYARSIGKQRCKQICDAFCRTIRNAGYIPMVYANLSTLTGYIASDLYKSWHIWVAQYAPKCQYKHPKYAWQYTSSGRVSGISGRIDMNYIYGQGAVSTPTKKELYPYTLPKLPKRGWFTNGDKGEQVKRLQAFLNWFMGYKRLAVDGEVGRKTMEAVREYEGIEKLKVDGLFGKKCLERAKVVRR